eukprot:GHVU01217426.1.p1 GENE.GHVU01217426.1~~GHVU01217426.1.p1  ORF type:complete len:609 (-),score=77.43 GHVU01217426.1:599-2425(-)
MKLILLLLSFVYVFAVEPGCEWGESYWCSELRVAQKCGAFDHCMETVWKNQIVTVDQDKTEICQYCENVIADVRNFLASGETEKQVQQFLDQACGVIPDAELSKQCKELVNNYTDQVFQLIRSGLDPVKVCSALGLCNGFKDKAVHSLPKPAPVTKLTQYPVHRMAEASSNLTCTECKAFIGEVKQVIGDKTYQTAIQNFLKDTLCPELKSEADICKSLVDAYLPEIFQLLENELDANKICSAIGFCKGSLKHRLLLATMKFKKSALFKATQKLGDEKCDLCKLVLTELSSLDRDKTVQKEIEDFIKTQVCARLGSIKDECDLTVDEFGPEFFQLLANELDPDTRCRSLGLCPAGGELLTKSAQETIRKATDLKKARRTEASTECIMCEFIMKEVSGLISSNATQSEIVLALDKVCSLLPKTIAAECQDFLNMYGKAILDLLSQELSPEVVCTSLGLCKGSKPATKPLHPVKILAGGELCGVCETVIQYLDSFLEENSTVQEIEALADKVCNFLPDTVRSQCEDLVQAYGPQIVQLLAQYMDPKEVCSMLHLCNKSTSVPMRKLTASKPHLLGTKECTYGPSFWCESMDNAVKCNAISHCKKHVWSKK